MDGLFALVVSFLLLIISVVKGYFIGYPLTLSMLIFIVILLRRGFGLRELLGMAVAGTQKSFPVFSVLFLIGAVTASWMAAGTVPAIVYYGLQLIQPQSFILAAFVLTSIVSLLIGTSFGTVGTIGVALMIMANGSGVNPHLIAGAIIAGAYVGDRCSPMSSSALLIAIVTQTDIYTNIRRMWKTSIAALLISLLVYGVFSLLHPVQLANPNFAGELAEFFTINWITLLPAIVILVLSIKQVEVKISMLVSITLAVLIACFMQHYSPLEISRFLVAGFFLDKTTPLSTILLGGGMLPMLRVCFVVMISTAFVGLFSGTELLTQMQTRLMQRRSLPISSSAHRFLDTALVGTGSAAFGCTQTIAILLTQQLVTPKYKENEKAAYNLALDLENTVVVLAPMIPWNIAGLVPATQLATDAGFIPYAVYLYLIPLLNFVVLL